jgi:hypothetical protein
MGLLGAAKVPSAKGGDGKEAKDGKRNGVTGMDLDSALIHFVHVLSCAMSLNLVLVSQRRRRRPSANRPSWRTSRSANATRPRQARSLARSPLGFFLLIAVIVCSVCCVVADRVQHQMHFSFNEGFTQAVRRTVYVKQFL